MSHMITAYDIKVKRLFVIDENLDFHEGHQYDIDNIGKSWKMWPALVKA